MKQVNRRYIVTLAIVAGAILGIGYAVRPRQPSAEPIQAPSQTELSRLTRITQRRSLESMAGYFATLADEVQGTVVSMSTLDRSGVLWEPGVVATVRLEARFPGATTVSTPAGEVGVGVVVSGPQLPIAAARMSDESLTFPPRRPGARLEPGDWMLAVWRRNRQMKFVPAHFLDATRIPCGQQLVEELRSSVPWSRDMAGGGLFDLDGRLIGLIVPCEERFAAVSVESVDTMLAYGRSVEGRIVRRYGMRLESLTDAERLHFGSNQPVVVREIWRGHLADTVGLRPGDIVVAINAEPIGSLDQLSPLVDASDSAAFDVAVRRGPDLVNVVLPTTDAGLESDEVADWSPGIVWEPAPVGHRVSDIVPDSPAARAGLQPGDRLVRIDLIEPEDFAAVEAALAADGETSVFLEVDRDGRRWGVLLP